MLLEGKDCEAEIAHPAEEAIKIFQKREFGIAIMDGMLPGKNAVECCLEVRAIRPGAHVDMMAGYSSVGSIISINLFRKAPSGAEPDGFPGIVRAGHDADALDHIAAARALAMVAAPSRFLAVGAVRALAAIVCISLIKSNPFIDKVQLLVYILGCGPDACAGRIPTDSSPRRWGERLI